MFASVKKHILVILLAIIVSFFTFAPQLLAINSLGDSFRGIYPINTDDDIYYLARSQDIVDGHVFLSNPYLYEHKEDGPVQFWLPDYLLAKPLSWLGVSIPVGFIFYDLVFGLLLVILTYIIFYLLTRSTFLSFISTAFLHLAMFLTDFAKTPSPQFNFVFCLLLVLFLIQYIRHNKKIYLILSTVSFGLLFHIYPYYWTFFLVLLGVFVTSNLLILKKIKWDFIAIIFGGLIIGLPYFLTMLRVMQLPYYEESVYRLGMIDTHWPSGYKIMMVVFLGLLFFAFSKYKTKLKINSLVLFLISGILSAAICVNQHLITGKNVEFSSHYWMLTVFCLVFLAAYLLNKYLINNQHKNKIYFILFLVVMIFAIYNQKSQVLADTHVNEEEAYWQQYSDVFDWLDKNTLKESVVYANNDISQLIPIYTNNNVFYARPANFHFLPKEEIFLRFTINNYFEDFSRDFIYEHMRFLWGVHYINEYGHQSSENRVRKILGLYQKSTTILPENVYQEFVDFKDKILEQDFYDLLTRYRVDYIVWDKNKNLNWQLEGQDFLKQVYISQSGNIIIFEIKYEK